MKCGNACKTHCNYRELERTLTGSCCFLYAPMCPSKFISIPDLNYHDDNAQVIDTTQTPFCAHGKCEIPLWVRPAVLPRARVAPCPEALPASRLLYPEECSCPLWQRNKNRSMPAEQKDILKTLTGKKKKILRCVPESAVYHFLQAFHLHNLPKYKFSITFQNFHQEAYKTAT